MSFVFKNYWVSALTADIAANATSLFIPNGDAALIPALSTGVVARLTIPVVDVNGNETDWEIIDVTAINASTGELTIARGIEGTTAKTAVAGARIDMRLTAGQISLLGDFKSNGTAPMTGDLNMNGFAITKYLEKRAAVTASAATTTLDLSTARKFVVTLNASTTLAFSNVPTTADRTVSVTIDFIQDATGSRVLTLPAGTKTDGGAGVTLSTAANARDRAVFEFDVTDNFWTAAMAMKGMA